MIYDCTIAIGELPSREEILYLEDIKRENDVVFAIAKQWTTRISLRVGETDLLTGYDYPVHSFLQELQKGILDLGHHVTVTIPIYAMEYPTPETIHHTLTLTKATGGRSEGTLCFTWCEHLPQVVTLENPYRATIRLTQLAEEICKQVEDYQLFLAQNFPEYYPRWAKGESAVFGSFVDRRRCMTPFQ